MTVRRPLVSLALGALALSALSQSASADPFETLERLDQARFLDLAEHLGAATHYKAVTPAESLGVIGFDLGIELSSTSIDSELFDDASDGDFGTGSLLVPRLHALKGLPFGIDIGASIGLIPSSDMTLIGGEARIALVEGNVALPAVGLRASYSWTEGSDDIEATNGALELTVSKGFLMLTPYAGVGIVHSSVDPTGARDTLADESFDQEKLYVGLNANLVGFNVTGEADRTGDHSSISAKLGIRF